MDKTETVVGQCEHCGQEYSMDMVVDGNQVVVCPTCKKESDNWDTPASPQMAPDVVTVTGTALSNREAILDIRSRMLHGELTHDEAKALAQPIIDGMNKKGEELAKTHGMKYKPLSFVSLMR